MKSPRKTVSKRTTPANIEALGAAHLAGLLLELAASQPALKRRLRMELAAVAGPGDLALEIDKRLAALAASRARVSWRKRGEFITDLEVVRVMIAERLGAADPDIGLARAWAFLDLAASLSYRVKDPRNELGPVFDRAATDLAALACRSTLPAEQIASDLAAAIDSDTPRWALWAELAALAFAPQVAAIALARLSQPPGRRRSADRSRVIRRLADLAGDVDAYIAATPQADLSQPAVGAGIARRLLAADRVEEAVAVLDACDPRRVTNRPFGWGQGLAGALDANFDWESAHIESLERAGQIDAAQSARWSSFERTLSPARLRDIMARLGGFEDVEAADKAFQHAARDLDATRGLAFLMDWPALPEAARMVAARGDEIAGPASRLEAWASRLRVRQPRAALALLEAAVRAAVRERLPNDYIAALRQEVEALSSDPQDRR